MIQGEERLGVESPSSRLADAIRYKIALLWSEVQVGSPLLARVGLLALALVLQTVVLYGPGHFRPAGNIFFALLSPVGTLGSLLLCGLAVIDPKAFLSVRTRQALAASALIALSVLSVMGTGEAVKVVGTVVSGVPYNNDGAALDLYAAEQVRHGRNPYVKTNIVRALAAINAPATTTTPLMRGQFRGARAYPSAAAIQQVFLSDLIHPIKRGIAIPTEFESKYNYPAGSFLFILPFVLAGVHDMRFLYTLAIVAMGFWLWRLMPSALRFLGAAVVLADVPLVKLNVGGQPDPLYALLLLVGYAEWATPWLSPLAMGLAIGTKQLAWFFVPFYLLVILRHFGLKEVLRRSLLMGAVFLALNGLFIARSPGEYVASIAAPMSDPMFPLGVGIIALFVSNVLPMAAKSVFTVVEAAVWLGGIALFARWRYLSPAAGTVLAILPLFFAWRSLVSYFYLVPIFVLAVVLSDARQRRRLT